MLNIPDVIWNRPLNVGDPFCPMTVALALFIQRAARTWDRVCRYAEESDY